MTASIKPQEALLRCIEHREIFHDEMLSLFRSIMSGEMTPVMIAALTVGFRVKKETVGEIAAAAEVMREFSLKVKVDDTANLLDIVGTGGDGAHTFNISTRIHVCCSSLWRQGCKTMAAVAFLLLQEAPICWKP